MNENIADKVLTEIDNKVNASLNNLEVNCITNKNNNFSLDSDGNLIVKSITSEDSTTEIDFNNIYPIGSLYLSVNSTNPSIYFGGIWEQISQGRCLLGVGSNIEPNNTNWAGELNNDEYSFWNGEMGGQFKHKLTIDEMPSHKHLIYQDVHGDGGRFAIVTNYGEGGGTIISRLTYSGTSNLYPSSGDNAKGLVNADYTGKGQSHNNMPLYLAVYIWKRVS